MLNMHDQRYHLGYTAQYALYTSHVDGIAWDWINKKLYWTDARHKTVEVLDPVRGHRKLLFRTGSTSNPRVIVLDPTTK